MNSRSLTLGCLLLGCLLLAACHSPTEDAPEGASVRLTPLVVPASSGDAYDVRHPSTGRLLSRIAVRSTALDRVELGASPDPGRRLYTLHEGLTGRSRLMLDDGQGRPRVLALAEDGESVGRASFAPDGERFAYVQGRHPAWVLSPDGVPRLQFQGDLWIGQPGGPHRRPDLPRDAARVLGWKDAQTLLFTRYLPGDLPTEAVFALDLDGGWLRPLAPLPGRLAYGITLSDGHLLFNEADQPIVTLPGPGERLRLVVADLDGRRLRERLLPDGVLAADLSAEDDGRVVAFFVDGTREQRRLDLGTGDWSSQVRALVPVVPPPIWSLAATLTMPYVHQVYDTPNDFNGNWACGPTSTVMALCHFGRLKKWPVTVSIPTSHTSDYGAYVAYTYSAYGTTFNKMQTDASGKAAYGAYGWCTDGGAAWAWRMQDYAKKHGDSAKPISSDFSYVSSVTPIKTDLDLAKVVVLSTQLTSSGHIVTVKGYTSSGSLVTNDPYGDKNKGYKNYYGENATYTWSQLGSKWYITVYGTVISTDPSYKASLVTKTGPATMKSGTTASASLTYKNEGTATWDSKTLLGTTNPRDRKSVFYTQGGWTSQNRPAACPASTKTGSQATFSFTLTAPKVCQDTDYVEYFNLVQEGTAWFSDSGQGGPSDTTVSLSIKVQAIDADGDKVTDCTDCNDLVATIYPGAVEVCNGKDDDCDKQIDEGLTCTGDSGPQKDFSTDGTPASDLSPWSFDGDLPGGGDGPGAAAFYVLDGGCAWPGPAGAASWPWPAMLALLWFRRRAAWVRRKKAA